MHRHTRQPERQEPARLHQVDQAQGLRRMFAARVVRLVPVVANATAACGGKVLERLCSAYTGFGLHTLVVDAGPQAREPGELVAFDLAEGIERLSDLVSYMPARGLPLRHVDARGSCASLLDALAEAAPQADVILVHATASEIVRLFAERASGRQVVPLVYTRDRAESLRDAYAAVKILGQRGGWHSFELLVCAPTDSPLADEIAHRLGQCADAFLGMAQRQAVRIDAREPAEVEPAPRVQELAGGLLRHAVQHTLSELAFDHLMSPGAALPTSANPAIN